MRQRITVSEVVMLVFVICRLLNIYGCLLVSASPLAGYYQHVCQRFALTFELSVLPHAKWAFNYLILSCFLSLTSHNPSILNVYRTAQNFDREKYWRIWQIFSNSSIFSKFSIRLSVYPIHLYKRDSLK